MLKRVERIVSLFTKVTTYVLFITAVYILLFWGAEVILGVELLWQILIVSGICALGSVILPIEEEKLSKYSIFFRTILYYLFLNAVVLAFAFYFGWYRISDWKQVLGMVVAVALGFIALTLISYWIEYQEAEKMNQKLKERK